MGYPHQIEEYPMSSKELRLFIVFGDVQIVRIDVDNATEEGVPYKQKEGSLVSIPYTVLGPETMMV